MTQPSGSHSISGVRISNDFRDNLIVDRYDTCFAMMRESKKKHLRSENSEDALSWNVFRSLRQISPEAWLNSLADRAFGTEDLSQVDVTTVELWKDVGPPPSLLESGDEGISEIDIVLENPNWVWFIEAKYKSDISEGTTTRPNRDQTRLLHKWWHVIVTRTPTFRVANASQNSPCSIRPCHDCRPITSVAYPHQR